MNNIQISSVILWQKDGFKRILEFQRNRVNVVTGDSGKGKSSILYIIDYCLLSSETTGISKTNIDSKVDWYGIEISIDGRSLVIARPSEAHGKKDQAFFNENGLIPEVPELNIRIDNLKKVLSSAFGIDTELRVPYGGKYIQTGSKVSFRNFLTYSYQDQNSIVSPDHLYIRPADGRFQEAIERTFRMAIGAENVDTALSRSRLVELERKRATQIRKNEAYLKAASAFSEEVDSLVSEAFSLGVVEGIPASYAEKFTVLEELVRATATPTEYKREIDRIEREIFRLSAKNRQLQEFIDDRPIYVKSLKEVEDSLKPVNAFNSSPEDLFPSKLVNEVIARLRAELFDIKKSLASRRAFPFLDEIKEIRDSNEEDIKNLTDELSRLEKSNPIRYNPRDYYRYLGRLEAKLDIYRRGGGQGLPPDVEKFDEDIAELEKIVSQNDESILLCKQKLNELINKFLKNLPLKGYRNFSANYSEKEKLIHLYSPDLKSVEKMPDVGSASNYLYLHISYFLAVHELARRLITQRTRCGSRQA